MEVFHLRMGYPSISQYIPIKRLRRCWTIMAIAWIFASEWQTNAQSSEKPTCCDWTSPARDGCAMCWKCTPVPWKCLDVWRSHWFTPGLWISTAEMITMSKKQPGLSGIYPSEKSPPWSLLKWMIYWWYSSMILHHLSPDFRDWVDLTGATLARNRPQGVLPLISQQWPATAMQVRAVRTLWICVS